MNNRARVFVGWSMAVAAMTVGCVAAVPDEDVTIDGDEDAIAANVQALSTAVAVDFSATPLGPLGSPWTVNKSGSGSATVVDTSDHGRALRIAHRAERDFSSASLAFPATSGAALDFVFAVKPTSAASTFTITLKGAKSGYRTPRFAMSLSPGSNAFVPSSIGAASSCGALPYGRWSTVRWTLVAADSSRRVMDVRINGVLLPACRGVTTSLRSADTLVITDNTQPSANADTLFDDLALRSGNDGEF